MSLTANIMICIFTILGFILLLFTALVVTCVFPNNSCGRWWCQKGPPAAYKTNSNYIENYRELKKPKHNQ